MSFTSTKNSTFLRTRDSFVPPTQTLEFSEPIRLHGDEDEDAYEQYRRATRIKAHSPFLTIHAEMNPNSPLPIYYHGELPPTKEKKFRSSTKDLQKVLLMKDTTKYALPTNPRRISIAHEGFTSIQQKEMKESVSIIDINASSNRLSLNDFVAFRSIMRIQLDDNHITELSLPSSATDIQNEDTSNDLNRQQTITTYSDLYPKNAPFRSLVALDLSRNRLTLDCLFVFSNFPSLEVLDVSWNSLSRISDQNLNFSEMSYFMKLHTLNISHNELCDDNLSLILLICEFAPHLAKLDISGNNLSSFKVPELADAENEKPPSLNIIFPRLRFLNLGRNQIFDLPTLMKNIAEIGSLQLLNLYQNPVVHDFRDPDESTSILSPLIIDSSLVQTEEQFQNLAKQEAEQATRTDTVSRIASQPRSTVHQSSRSAYTKASSKHSDADQTTITTHSLHTERAYLSSLTLLDFSSTIPSSSFLAKLSQPFPKILLFPIVTFSTRTKRTGQAQAGIGVHRTTTSLSSANTRQRTSPSRIENHKRTQRSSTSVNTQKDTSALSMFLKQRQRNKSTKTQAMLMEEREEDLGKGLGKTTADGKLRIDRMRRALPQNGQMFRIPSQTVDSELVSHRNARRRTNIELLIEQIQTEDQAMNRNMSETPKSTENRSFELPPLDSTNDQLQQTTNSEQPDVHRRENPDSDSEAEREIDRLIKRAARKNELRQKQKQKESRPSSQPKDQSRTGSKASTRQMGTPSLAQTRKTLGQTQTEPQSIFEEQKGPNKPNSTLDDLLMNIARDITEQRHTRNEESLKASPSQRASGFEMYATQERNEPEEEKKASFGDRRLSLMVARRTKQAQPTRTKSVHVQDGTFMTGIGLEEVGSDSDDDASLVPVEEEVEPFKSLPMSYQQALESLQFILKHPSHTDLPEPVPPFDFSSSGSFGLNAFILSQNGHDSTGKTAENLLARHLKQEEKQMKQLFFVRSILAKREEQEAARKREEKRQELLKIEREVQEKKRKREEKRREQERLRIQMEEERERMEKERRWREELATGFDRTGTVEGTKMNLAKIELGTKKMERQVQQLIEGMTDILGDDVESKDIQKKATDMDKNEWVKDDSES
ncbi:hypothetical protein BLNAU_22284 [Blattamonas nauphoetae]|uniref:Uncharacterized protein n=1 Tax=Blattamonas nauphoetae TaxID=2049346 RepID=A0ABQ9WXR6_9EUKA|nr:hypothetical protein BLNAU_22284 [Blattamonas nauphoetae]